MAEKREFEFHQLPSLEIYRVKYPVDRVDEMIKKLIFRKDYKWILKQGKRKERHNE